MNRLSSVLVNGRCQRLLSTDMITDYRMGRGAACAIRLSDFTSVDNLRWQPSTTAISSSVNSYGSCASASISWSVAAIWRARFLSTDMITGYAMGRGAACVIRLSDFTSVDNVRWQPSTTAISSCVNPYSSCASASISWSVAAIWRARFLSTDMITDYRMGRGAACAIRLSDFTSVDNVRWQPSTTAISSSVNPYNSYTSASIC